MAKVLGWLTLAGLVVTVLAIVTRFLEVAYPIPITLLCVGAGCTLAAGLPWAHTAGKPRWKAAFLGLVGYAGGAALGLFVGEAATPPGENNLGLGVLLLTVGWWVGGILFAALGVWWGNRFHRRSAAAPDRDGE
jgi:hypothetical protein